MPRKEMLLLLSAFIYSLDELDANNEFRTRREEIENLIRKEWGITVFNVDLVEQEMIAYLTGRITNLLDLLGEAPHNAS